MRRRVNALRQSGNDGDAMLRQLLRELVAGIPAVSTGFARADDGEAFFVCRCQLART